MPFNEMWELKERWADREGMDCFLFGKSEMHFVHVKFEISLRHPRGDG